MHRLRSGRHQQPQHTRLLFVPRRALRLLLQSAALHSRLTDPDVCPSPRPSPKQAPQLQDAPLPGEDDSGSGGSGPGSESEVEISEEDFEFVRQHAGRVGFLETLDAAALDRYAPAAKMRPAPFPGYGL
jgi:hypothetical protein